MMAKRARIATRRSFAGPAYALLNRLAPWDLARLAEGTQPQSRGQRRRPSRYPLALGHNPPRGFDSQLVALVRRILQHSDKRKTVEAGAAAVV